MEKCPPGGDYASGEGDPSKSDKPPARWTPNPAGEQAQGKSVPTGDGVSQAASHSPELKRKKGSSATSASQVLKKHEDEFFDVVNPTLSLPWLKHKEVISEGLISKIETADTRDAQVILFEHLHRNANVAALREYCKMAIAEDDFPRMQNLGEKMLKELALEGVSRGDDVSQAASHSPELKRRKVSSTVSALQVLDEFRDQFIQDMDSNAVVLDLLHHDIISKGDQRTITRTEDPIEQNKFLHLYLKEKCTEDAFHLVCDIISKVKGNQKMSALGTTMKRRLATGATVSPSALGEPHTTTQHTVTAMSRGDDVSQPASHSSRLKRKKDSSATSGPMTEWHRAALVELQGSLKLNVKMIQLSDMLERPAGGFMDRAEALSVKAKTGDTEQMGELISILLGKEDMAFYTFCDLLERSNYEVWARELKSAAERRKTVGAPNEGGQTARRISVSKPTAPGVPTGDGVSQAASHSPQSKRKKDSSATSEPITEQREAVTGETDKSPKECRSSTKEVATFSTGFNIPLLFLVGLVVYLVLQMPSSDQKAVARYKVDEEVRKGLKEETSVVPEQVTGGPTATTTGCQAQTQSAVPGQVTGGPTAAARGSQPPTQVAVSPVIKAAKFGKVAAVRKLLDEGAATVEDRDENGSNALHIAAKFGHLELVKFLIPIFGEKKFAVNHSGDTCLDLAIKHEEEDIVEYLIQEGGFGR